MLPTSQSELYFSLGLVFFLLDRALKYLFYYHKISDSFFLSYTENPGIAFGLQVPKNLEIFFYISIGFILVYLIYLLSLSTKHNHQLTAFSIWLIILGAISNIIDRIRFGFVIDYINFHFWPVFNLADTIIVVGVVLLLIISLKKDYQSNQS